MMIASAPSVNDDGGNFSADSPPNSDDEQLDDTPFLSHQLPADQESFSEKFLRNILTHDYQNLMPRRREKFVEITKTVTVTEIVNGAPDKHPSSCEVKVTNVSPAGPHPVNVSIKHVHEKWHSCDELDRDLGKGTVIHIHETHKPFSQKNQKSDRFVYEDVVRTKVDTETRARQSPTRDTATLFNRSSDNVIDLEFRHPILVETSTAEKTNGSSRRRFADLRKRVSTTTKTSTTETEKVTTTRRSSSAHSTSSRKSYGKPEVHTLYYRKFVEEDHKNDSSSDSGSVIIRRDSATRRSQSADPLRHSPVTSPVAPPRKRLGREESLHYYRDDDEVQLEQKEPQKVGFTTISMNNSCTDTSFESRFSTIPRARSSPPGGQRINHIHVNVIGPMRTPEAERRHPVVGRVGDDVTMDIFIDEHGSGSVEAPPKPPRRSKWENHHHIGEPLATSTPMTTIERKVTREERTESEQSSRKSTRSSRPPDINIIECESSLRETRSPARTPATPIIVINQTPSSRRSSQDLLGDPAQRRRKSTVTDIDWYAAFNMKDPSSPTKLARPPFGHPGDERKHSRDVRRRASDSSTIGIPPADIDLNQIFSCSSPQIKKDEKCQCNACRLIRMSEAERASRMVRESRTRQSKTYQKSTTYESRSSTLPSRHRTAPVEIRLEDVFEPKPSSPKVTSKPPTPPMRRRQASTAPPSSFVDESPSRHHAIDRSQVTPVSTNSRDGSELHASHQLLSSSEGVDWVGQMMHDAGEWEHTSRKSSTASSGARKASVARRISVDELTKPEKRKSRGSVSFPPSDVSIDDIFTALTHKKDAPSVEKKTFIVTRKQRAQDVDPIDFERDRQSPVAPPRATKSDDKGIVIRLQNEPLDHGEPETVLSTATITLSPVKPIDLDDVFDGQTSLKQMVESSEEDERIKRRVAEFERSQQEKRVGKSEEKVEKTTRRTSWEDSNISMDDVFNADEHQVAPRVLNDSGVSMDAVFNGSHSGEFEGSEAVNKRDDVIGSTSVEDDEKEFQKNQQEQEQTLFQAVPALASSVEKHQKAVGIDLDDVFVSGTVESHESEDEEDRKIRRRVAEFERSQAEKKVQKAGEEETTARPSQEIFEPSDISMDDVFNTSRVDDVPAQLIIRDDVPKPKETSTVQLNLEDVFAVSNVSEASSKEDEEDRKIQKRVKEFEKTQKEKEVQTEVEKTTVQRKHEFETSDISLDAVFVQSQNNSAETDSTIGNASKSLSEKDKPSTVDDDSTDILKQTATSSAHLNLDDVFAVSNAPKAPSEEDEEDKKIQQRVREFEKTQKEKEIQTEVEKTTVQRKHEFETSDISMDAVFRQPQKSSRDTDESVASASTSTILPKPIETSSAQLNLEEVFALNKSPEASSKDDEEEDKKIQQRVKEFEKTQREKEIQIDVEKTTVEREIEFATSDISLDSVFSQPRKNSMDDVFTNADAPKGLADKVTSSAQLNLEDVFAVSNAPIAPSKEDEEDKKIQQRVKEFEKTQREKELQTDVEKTTVTRKHDLETSNISLDAVFAQSQKSSTDTDESSSIVTASTSTAIPKPIVNSSVQLNLEDVFAASNTSKAPSKEDEEDKKIQQRVKEFERTQKEKEIQVEVERVTVQKNHDFETSDISLDAVFSQSQKSSTDDADSSTTVPQPNVTSSAQLNLNDVFAVNDAPSTNEDLAEKKKIQQRVKEFEKAQREKEIQTEVEKVTVQKNRDFETSDISMDDVFNQSQMETTDDDGSTTLPKPEEISSAQLNLEDVFTITSGPKAPSQDDEEDRKIQQRVKAFEKTQKEKEMQTEVEKTTVQRKHEFETSDITKDAVFNQAQGSSTDTDGSSSTTTPSTSTTLPKPNVTSSAHLNLDDVFAVSNSPKAPSKEDEEDKKIQQRVKEFEKTQREKEMQTEVEKTTVPRKQEFETSDISLDAVFSQPRKIFRDADESSSIVTASTSTTFPKPTVTSSAQLNLEDVFAVNNAPRDSSDDNEEDKKIQQRVKEFEKTQREKELQTEVEKTTVTRKLDFKTSDISLDAVFSPSRKISRDTDEPTSVASASTSTTLPKPTVTSSVQLNLEDVFAVSDTPKAPSKEDEEDKKIQQRVREFEKTQKEKEMQTEVEKVTVQKNHDFETSDISLDAVFSQPERSSRDTNESSSIATASTSTTLPKPTVTSSAQLNLEEVFAVNNAPRTPSDDNEEDRKIQQRVKEFEKTQKENEVQIDSEKTTVQRKHDFDTSDISMDDVFSQSQKKYKDDDAVTSTANLNLEDVSDVKSSPKDRSGESQKDVFVDSNISMDSIFNVSSHSDDTTKPSTSKPSDEKTSVITSENETTRTETTTTTETSTDTYTKRTTYPGSDIKMDDIFSFSSSSRKGKSSLDEMFGPQTPTKDASAPVQNKFISNLIVPEKWNESMMSTTSTISLEDSFDKSTRKPLSLPVNSWIDDLAAKTTDEATREAPKTPKSANYYPSPTTVSLEIKYEWEAELVGVTEQDEKQDGTWISSVVYRPSQASEPELDMNKVFNECLMGMQKDDEECECSACRLTEQELEEMRRKKIESEHQKSLEGTSEEPEQKIRHVEVSEPSQISIDEIFHPEVPLHIQTEPSQVPSTSSPPLANTRTYYLSPKVSETVTTTHQWKDADISLDDIFSPVSSTTNDNRRFSNFYEDRSGWDTMGSEDSGVMSGGDRGRRRSSRTVDRVIDDAFKDIFETQPTSSSFANKTEQSERQYDDYYITSLNEGDIEATDSEVDGENLDVTQFVDDILGKSLDEAAFLSSTKSLRDHTDTSIDRKKSGERVHPYYRTRTDTSMDKRSKPAVINEDLETHESHDEIMKLVFVDSSSKSRRSMSKVSTAKAKDEELLEIEIKPEYFLIKGSYSLLIPKSEPLGQMLEKLRDENDSLATLDFSLTRKLKKLLVNCIREKAGTMASPSLKYDGLSSRGQSLIESIDHASSTFLRMNVDKFEPTRNPHGIVNFCTAENNICTPLLEERFKHIELFFPNTEHLARYPPAGGWPEARQVLTKYFKEFMNARVPTEELVLTASTRTGYDVVSYCLFEQDDVLLTNGPVYTGTISNVQERALCKVECVPTDLSHPRLDVKQYEAELARQTALDNTVSGVIIVNPHNPLGVVYPPEDVVNLCNWAAAKNLHVVIDEVFANCVFDKSASKFRPFLSYRHRVHHPENIAWLWSVSKDFGLPGLKFAVIHSANEGLRKAAQKLQLYHPCSPFVQDFAVKLLSDSEWLLEFHTEVTRRMAIHYRYTADNLRRLEIPFVPAQAGIFVFADFSRHLTSIDEAGELALFERLGSAGVMLTPGVHQKCHVFGWFRLVFACSKQELEEGFRRLYHHLGSQLQPIGTVHYDNN